MTGVVVTFYSFKGGVGRTLALANVATLLARWGYRVLCVDWDLEAPGIDRYFRGRTRNLGGTGQTLRPGLVDWIIDQRRGVGPNWRNYVTKIDVPAMDQDRPEPELDLMTAGEPGEFVSRLQQIDWAALFSQPDFVEALESMRDEWRDHYDYVLIDSRTGISDSGSICTIHLPDYLVLMTTANDQGIEGILDVWQRANERRDEVPFDRSRLSALPVLNRFEARAEVDLAREWAGKFDSSVKGILENWRVKETPPGEILKYLRVPYVAKWSYGEQLPVLSEGTGPDSIGYAFETITALLSNHFAGSDLLVESRDSYVLSAKRTASLRHNEGYVYDVFIDYAPKDQDLAKAVQRRLRSEGMAIVLGPDVRQTGVAGEFHSMDTVLARSRHLALLIGERPSETLLPAVKRFLDLTYEKDAASNAKEGTAHQERGIAPILLSKSADEHLPRLLRSFRSIRPAGDSFDEVTRAVVDSLGLSIPFPSNAPSSAPPARPTGSGTVDALLAELNDQTTGHQRRLAIGDELAKLGDSRPGVGVTPDGTPDFEWCTVEGGEVTIEGIKGKVQSFSIARYLVTWAQYEAFFADQNGYRLRKWWRDIMQPTQPGSQRWPIANRPAENVSWYDAIAFCRWTSDRLGYEVRLPSEFEWQIAATGGNPDYVYPWGVDWDPNFANTRESGLEQTTAVGVYPGGSSPNGALDLAGNAWEWCLNKYGSPQDTDPAGKDSRVLRGGSWYSVHVDARASYRVNLDPDSRSYYIGFRVVCVSPIR